MLGAYAVASAYEQDGHSYRQDVYDLHGGEHRIIPEPRIDQQQKARKKPDRPGKHADPPGAFFRPQMMYLRIVRDNNKRRSYPTEDFHL